MSTPDAVLVVGVVVAVGISVLVADTGHIVQALNEIADILGKDKTEDRDDEQ